MIHWRLHLLFIWTVTCFFCVACGNDGTSEDGKTDSANDIITGKSDTATVNSDSDPGNEDSASDTAATNDCASPFESTAALEDTFDGGWSTTQTLWRRASWTQNGTAMSPDRCIENSEGLLEQTVLEGTPFQGGSMQSRDEYHYGRWVARLKPSSVPGVLNSMFTMDWDDMTTTDDDGDGTHEEIDIEFLTYTFGANSGSVHFAVHKPPHSNYFVNDVELNFNPSDDFHEWGFDVLPDKIQWHVDGAVLAQFAFDATVSITGQYEMFFNSWTKESWINGPPRNDAIYQIDWVRYFPLKAACR
ncbi:MAG: glycoside hydrolase family 16 protein [Deltaproteobacteria bacterium]|nr:glycoside hydrolase family 16 protein [Deltaproteobacteria bacterium]